jgi:hypothetical protein
MRTIAGIGTVAFLWGVLIASLFGGCEALPTAGDECPAGQVVQVDLCPGTAGKLATCLAMGPDEPGTQPVQVAWCQVEATPPEGGTDWFLCVPVCP